MRLFEIDDKTAEIQDILNDKFTYRKGTNIDIVNNIVYVDGDIGLKSSKAMNSVKADRKERLKQLRADKLPIQFGKVNGNFSCRSNVLITLEGCPELVGGIFHCDGNKLRNLIGGPKYVNGDYDCERNPLQSLDGLPEQINGYFSIPFRKHMPLLKLFFVKGVKNISISPLSSSDIIETRTISNILNKHIGNGAKGALLAAAELIRAGYKEMAQR